MALLKSNASGGGVAGSHADLSFENVGEDGNLG